MDRWYVLRAKEKREQEAAQLLMHKADPVLWSECRVLKKVKVFRSGGSLKLVEDILFPGYVFVRTQKPEELAVELQKSREFPHFLELGKGVIELESEELAFLYSVCGENLQKPMGITEIVLNNENQIIQADGILEKYLHQIVKLKLHKRYALVEVPLFNRTQTVLFGLCLPQDQYCIHQVYG